MRRYHAFLARLVAVCFSSFGCGGSGVDVGTSESPNSSNMPDDGAPRATSSAALDPCLAANPMVLLDETIERRRGKPDTTSLPFQMGGDSAVCIQIVTMDDGTGHRLTSGDITLDGTSLLDESDFKQSFTGNRFVRHLAAGSHEMTTRLRSRPGTALRITVSAPGPEIDAFHPQVVTVGDTIIIRGRWFTPPVVVTAGTQQLPLDVSSSETVQVRADRALPLTPLTVQTPFGAAVTRRRLVSLTPSGGVLVYDREPRSDPVGDAPAPIDVSSLTVVDDGHTVSIVARFGAVPGSFSTIDLRLLETRNDAPEVAVSVPYDDDRVSIGADSIAVSLGYGDTFALDRSAMGRFLLNFRVTGTVGTDYWPAADEYFDVRPVFAPRFIRFRSTTPATVAMRYGATLLGAVGGLGLMEVPPDAGVPDVLRTMLANEPALGAVPEPMVYSTAPYTPILSDVSCANAGQMNDSFAPTALLQWDHAAVHAAEAWSDARVGNPRGAGVKVIVADDGVLPHEEFDAGRVEREVDLLWPGTLGGMPTHGTGVASIIAADPNNGGIAGLAPAATVISYKVLDQNGATTGLSVVKAIDQATADQFSDPAIRVINMSFAEVPLVTKGVQVLLREFTLFPNFPQWVIFAVLNWNEERNKLADATSRFVVTASAGNTGDDDVLGPWGSTFPANVPGVISVGAAIRGNPVRAWAGSTRDDTVAIAAPSAVWAAQELIKSDAGREVMLPWDPRGIGCFGGTSAAAPEVAAGAAVLLSAVTPDGGTARISSIKGLLMVSATPMAESRRHVGAGLMDLQAAVARLAGTIDVGWTYTLETPHAFPRDVTHVIDSAYFLTSAGSAIALEPTTQGSGTEATHGAPSLDFLIGVTRIDGGGERFLGTARDAGAAFGIAGTVSAGLGFVTIPLTGSPVNRSVTVPIGDGGVITLIPTTAGIESVAFTGGFFRPATLALARPLIRELAVSRAMLPDLSNRLVAITSGDGGTPLSVELMRFSPGTSSITVDQRPISLPTSFVAPRVSVGNAAFGSSVFAPTIDSNDFPIWVAEDQGRAMRIGARTGGAMAGSPSNVETFVGQVSGIVAHPSVGVADMFLYAFDGKLTRIDSITGAVLDRDILGTQFEALSVASINASGTSISFVNEVANFLPGQPDHTYYLALLAYGL